jgi:hypothetical protein
MMRKLGDVMRVFAWCLVVAGLVIGMIRDIDEEVRPAGVIVSPWPGVIVIAGAGVSAFRVDSRDPEARAQQAN